MSYLSKDSPGEVNLLMGNEAIARGAIEAGVAFASAYPGNPSSEIITVLGSLAKELGIYVEWSTNEKVAIEAAAGASYAGLRSICAMKQNGLNVASDFISNAVLTGVGPGGMVLIVADDPGGISSSNEEDTRFFSRLLEIPLLEPAGFQEAKDMTKFAFKLSEETGLMVMIRSVTRISHGRGNVVYSEIEKANKKARFDTNRTVLAFPVPWTHKILHDKMAAIKDKFEESDFNRYEGPAGAELVVAASGAAYLYTKEALNLLGLSDRVGVLKIGTTFPLPDEFIARNLKGVKKVLVAEEVLPFVEASVKEAYANHVKDLGVIEFYGKASGHLPKENELSPDIMAQAIAGLTGTGYVPVDPDYQAKIMGLALPNSPYRALTFCAGCPHRASYWDLKKALKLDGRDGFIVGDIGCYTIGLGPQGYSMLRTTHAMGSGSGLATGLGQLKAFGLDQPVLAVSGDSTFYHSVIPALINAAHHESNFTMIVLDNSTTAMTGAQPHSGSDISAMGIPAHGLSIEKICQSLGAKVRVLDPFNVEETVQSVHDIIQDDEGIKVIIMRQECCLYRLKKDEKRYEVRVDQKRCLGDACGCNRLCTRVFKCPGILWDRTDKVARIDEVICNGCGVCADICPEGAIIREASHEA
jgi:indolepyruvate ferredoxin oxidoreductase, alpha subunit